MTVARRVHHLTVARRRWGARADRVAELYRIDDPEVAQLELAPFYADFPDWLDVERCNLGGRVLRRYGLLTAAVLRCYALPLSYLSPAGIRPLTATSSLVDEAGARLYRTAEYVFGTQAEGAMAPRGPGWELSAKIRMVHEGVRRRMRAKGWDEADGAPIPQPDLAGTALLFGPVTVEGLRRFGAEIDADEADAVAHLSRAMAHGQGVLPELQADTYAEALDLMALLTSMNGSPDEDGRALMDALLSVPSTLARNRQDRWIASPLERIYRSLASELLGTSCSTALGCASRVRLSGPIRTLTRRVPATPWFLDLQDRSVHWVMLRGSAKLRERR